MYRAKRDEKCVNYFRLETKRKKPLFRLEYVWEDNIKVDLKGFTLDTADSELSRLNGFCENGDETLSSRKGEDLLNQHRLLENN
jgi:hypothetical protein